MESSQYCTLYFSSVYKLFRQRFDGAVVATTMRLYGNFWKRAVRLFLHDGQRGFDWAGGADVAWLFQTTIHTHGTARVMPELINSTIRVEFHDLGCGAHF